VVPTQTD